MLLLHLLNESSCAKLIFSNYFVINWHSLFQKLSINGDLEYLNEISEKKGVVFSPIHLQEETDAAPLPIKIQLHQV